MYCTIEYLKTQVPEIDIANLSNDSGEGVINTELVESIITDKSSYIDVSLRGRYTLPLTNEHPLLSEICSDLVMATLYTRRPGSKKAEEIKAMIDYAELRLRGLQNGDKVLDESSPTTGLKAFTMQKTMPTKVFNKTLLDQMI